MYAAHAYAQLARLLEVGLVINVEHFPAFRVAFEPALIEWDVHPNPPFQKASETAEGDSALQKQAAHPSMPLRKD